MVGLPRRGSCDENTQPKPPPKPKREAVAPEVKLSLEEALVLKHVTDTPVGIDALVRKTGLTAARVNTVVVQLRMKRKVRLHPGNRVSRFA
jgi:predicted Rossmann fold nucleotide-binding protein DprA/Smf involved in DNA uptake